jgi:O-antigen biosynthesis protein
VQMGHVRKELGDLEGADNAYSAASQLDPLDADLLLNHGHLKKLRSDLRSAARLYRQSFEIDYNIAAAEELERPIFNAYVEEAERSIEQRPWISSHVIAQELRTNPVGSIDAVHGWTISGWAVDRDFASVPAEVAFFADGKLVGRATASRFRHVVRKFGMGSPIAGFETVIDLDFSQADEVQVSARIARTGQELANSPVQARAPAPFHKWLQRKARTTGEALALVRDYMAREASGRLSIIMPVYNTRPDWLREAITSVLDQWYDDWELICVNDCSPGAHVREILDEFAARDNRIRAFHLDSNVGIAAATNRGIAAATGDLIGFMDHDDYLEPDAVFRMLEAAKSGAELIYSDEALTGESIQTILHVAARPAFSHDYYLSHPYFVHFVCVRAELAREVGGLDESMAISADVDFVLRAIERSTAVAHVPAVLYRWRTHATSTGHAKKAEVTDATLGALNRHLKRFGFDATAAIGLGYNNYRVEFADKGEKVLIVIPTKNRHDLLKVCIDSVRRTTAEKDVDILVIDHESNDPATLSYLNSIRGEVTIIPYKGKFNYARMNNIAVAASSADHEYILFMNNDLEAIEPGWLERMRSLCGRSDVGVVGATLLYGNRTIQHAGVVMGLGDLVDHAHKFLLFENGGERNRGYNLSLVSTRDYSAVTGACMMIRRELFLGVGGFDEQLEIGYNDTDLCLRVGELGLKILNDPYAVLYHHESATRTTTNELSHPEDGQRLARRWSALLREGDPFYNPLLIARPAVDHAIGSLDDTYAKPRLRPVRAKLLPPETVTPQHMSERKA